MSEKPKLIYDAPKHQYLYEWQVGEYLWVSEPVFDSTREYVEALEAENAKLRELLDFALPIAMYAASIEEGDWIRKLMREVEL